MVYAMDFESNCPGFDSLPECPLARHYFSHPHFLWWLTWHCVSLSLSSGKVISYLQSWFACFSTGYSQDRVVRLKLFVSSPKSSIKKLYKNSNNQSVWKIPFSGKSRSNLCLLSFLESYLVAGTGLEWTLLLMIKTYAIC